MPIINRAVRSELPKPLQPFAFLGLDLNWRAGDDHASAECPFCGDDRGKFRINVTNGLWDCKPCQEEGNLTRFQQGIWELGEKATTQKEYEALAGDRQLLRWDSLKAWGVVRSVLTGEWLVPGWTFDGALNQLYRYARLLEKGKWVMRLLPCPVLDGPAHRLHGLAGGKFWDVKKSETWVAEGPWDGIALWETLRYAKRESGEGSNGDGTGSTVVLTGVAAQALANQVNVVAVPGAGVFPEVWAEPMAGKRVSLFYDNDHPREHPPGSGRTIQAGFDGMRRAAGVLTAADEPPEALAYLCWGIDEETPHNLVLKSGHDVRDVLAEGGGSTAQRVVALAGLLGKLRQVPSTWVGSRSTKPGHVGEIELLPCSNWKDLVNEWRKAMAWTPGLDLGLSVILSAILSTDAGKWGEQIWLLCVSPPSTGKSVLAEAVATASKYVVCKSTLKELYSGYKTDKEGSEDHSFIKCLQGKALIIKEGDTLLKNPDRAKILSQYRDAYDGVGRSQFNNGTSRDYTGTRFVKIICGTAAVYELHTADLGSRYLTVVLMHGIDPLFEKSVSRRVVSRAFRNIRSTTNGAIDTKQDEDLFRARRMTGGYVCHLREHAEELLGAVEVEEWQEERIADYGEFVAMLRGRPSKSQDEVVEREFSPRLSEQFARLAACLTVVLGKTLVDDEVLRRVRQVALDTARGRTLEIARHLFDAGRDVGMSAATLCSYTNQLEASERTLLHFLKKVGVVEIHKLKTVNGQTPRQRWRLTVRMEQLWREVMEVQEEGVG